MTRWGRPTGDRGFTLVELMVTLTLFGVLVSLGAMPLRDYQHRQEHLGAAREVVEALRNTQVRAVAEGVPYKVVFTAGTVAVHRGNGAGYDATPLRRYALPSRVTLTVGPTAFTPSASSSLPASPDAYFYARGTASAGELVVGHSDSTKTYTIDIEGLTARVSVS